MGDSAEARLFFGITEDDNKIITNALDSYLGNRGLWPDGKIAIILGLNIDEEDGAYSELRELGLHVGHHGYYDDSGLYIAITSTEHSVDLGEVRIIDTTKLNVDCYSEQIKLLETICEKLNIDIKPNWCLVAYYG